MSIENKIQNDTEYIDAPKYNNSVKQILIAHPNGLSLTIICKILHLTQIQYSEIYQSALNKLKQDLDIDLLKNNKNK